MNYTDTWLQRRYPDLYASNRAKQDEQPAPEPTAEEKLEAIRGRNEAIDAEVKATVKAFFPHLLDPADRQPKASDPQSELDREVSAIAERYLRSKS